MDGSSDARLNVLNTPGVVRILTDGPNPAHVPVEQIQAIQLLLRSGAEWNYNPYDSSGKEAVVARGPLSGIRGKIVERRGTYHLIFSVDLIQRSVAAEIDIRDVELA